MVSVEVTRHMMSAVYAVEKEFLKVNVIVLVKNLIAPEFVAEMLV